MFVARFQNTHTHTQNAIFSVTVGGKYRVYDEDDIIKLNCQLTRNSLQILNTSPPFNSCIAI